MTDNYLPITSLDAISGVRYVEGLFLARLVREYRPLKIVEIGSCEGRSSAYIAKSLQVNGIPGTLYCVDLWELGIGKTPAKHHNPSTHRKFQGNLKLLGLYNYVVELQGNSDDIFDEWQNGEIDMLFIDGGHKYEEVLSDFMNWSQLLKSDGILSFHDANQEGVSKVIRDFVIKSGDWDHIGQEDRLTAFQKRS